MPAGVAYDEVSYGAGTKVVGPFFSSASGCGGISSLVAVVVVCRTSWGGTGAKNFGIGVGSARWNTIGFSAALIRLASKGC